MMAASADHEEQREPAEDPPELQKIRLRRGHRPRTTERCKCSREVDEGRGEPERERADHEEQQQVRDGREREEEQWTTAVQREDPIHDVADTEWPQDRRVAGDRRVHARMVAR
jgi:hypothetical protein